MLVVDIDDTLLNSHNKISPETVRGIKAMQEAGHVFVLASGRPTVSVQAIAKSLGMNHYPEYLISFNGSILMNMQSEEVLFSHYLLSEDIPLILQTLKDYHLSALTYDEASIIIDERNTFTHIEEELTGLPTRYDAKFFQDLDQPLLKLIGVGDPQMITQLVEDKGGRLGKATRIVTSKPFYLEIMHQTVSKGDALQALCKHLNMSLADVIAVGDGNNDLQMLEIAGKGIAVANGSPAILEMADEIVPSNDEDGVLYTIEKYFLAND